ncbi:putative SCF complex member Cullin 1 [Guyanagaster necrorhizus]|uniref:SCF complex member Cullin 1 n=1 Tax=Guyanagaster necrorhizus TaxID=856835 RepID=A0A9P8AP83_9AGAR|nr:putative SCF complex member Cullin 1 [Guyanagaster necrorhizus MCA 3950]KAG7441592.1 putative SCF complex member Cullin 1 [Guyanagaster necrorhizus MCA 3950]
MLPKTVGLEETWAFLNPGVDHIMSNLEAGLTFAYYATLYTVTYNYCTTTKTAGCHTHANNYAAGANMAGSELYHKIIEYFTIHFASMKQYLNRLFTYLNRYWILRQRDEGRKEIYSVYTKSQFFVFIQTDNQKLAKTVLCLVERQRNGEMIDRGLVRKVVLFFVSFGLDNFDLNKECLEVYKEYIEPQFIKATDQSYKKESEAFLAENTVSDYLDKADECLWEEEDRVERYLHTKTRKVLIQKYVELMWDYFLPFLDFDQGEDLQRIYALLSCISDGLDPLRKRFEVHVKQAGLSVISKLVGEGSAVDVDPKIYVDALLEVHQKNSETVTRSFRGEVGFTASLDKACKEFVNRNAATGSSSTKSAELLAEHADILLWRNNKMAEGDLESALNRVMVLFKCLEDKDVFQKFYTTKLSKRLIQGVSASDESEASMILKLKEACGFEYSNKLQRVFTDMSLSKDLTDSFKKRMAQNHDDMDITFTVVVLSTNIWPLNPPTHDFTIPNYSKNELRTNYLNQKYILMTSAYQMAVLVQYNRNDTLSLDGLSAATSISEDILSQVLALLVRVKILVNKEKDQYDLNSGFKSKKIRVNLNQPIKVEVKAESSDVLKAIDEDRKYIIQATIVRIMKARKTMKNQALIQEVISLISHRFAPKIPDINKAVETLLEKEYIDRVEGRKDTFVYVA